MPTPQPTLQFSTQPTTSLIDISLHRTTLDEAVATAIAHAQRGDAARIHLLNSYSLALADKEPEYGALLRSGGVHLPDGLPTTKAMNLLDRHTTRASQVRGPSFFEQCLDKGRSASISHYFLGGDEPTLALLQQKALEKYPGLLIAGAWSPPFRPLTEDELTEQDQRIRESGAQIVWVGLGTPKQDYETARLYQSVGLPVAAVGAGFDFLAGTKPTAPTWMQQLALEWVFRLLSEPRRLWKRYLFGNVRFLTLVAKELRNTRTRSQGN